MEYKKEMAIWGRIREVDVSQRKTGRENDGGNIEMNETILGTEGIKVKLKITILKISRL